VGSIPSTSGYDGAKKEELKPPEECEWIVKLNSVASNEDEPDVHYATITVDGEAVGSVRLPSPEYVRYLRERIHK